MGSLGRAERPCPSGEPRLIPKANIVDAIDDSHDNLSADLATIKADLATIKADLATIKADLATIKTDIAAINADLAIARADVRKLLHHLGIAAG